MKPALDDYLQNITATDLIAASAALATPASRSTEIASAIKNQTPAFVSLARMRIKDSARDGDALPVNLILAYPPLIHVNTLPICLKTAHNTLHSAKCNL